jgi:hypothetical protein
MRTHTASGDAVVAAGTADVGSTGGVAGRLAGGAARGCAASGIGSSGGGAGAGTEDAGG